MCVNVAFPSDLWINNQGQKLAGTGVFVSRPRGLATTHDDPLELNICRLHFEERHNGSWGDLEKPVFFNLATPEIPNPWCPDEDMTAYLEAIMSDSAVGRGFWKTAPTRSFSLFNSFFLSDEELDLAKQVCTKGAWAWVLAQMPYEDGGKLSLAEGDSITLGGWHKDGYGCYLSYAIPVGAPVEFVGEGFSAGPSGLIYQVGSLGVKIPWGTKWALWIRCSDTGVHAGFTVVHLRWYEDAAVVEPVLASLFPAPHVFPAEGYFFDPQPVEYKGVVGDSLADALALAHLIAENGGFPTTPPKPIESYDTTAWLHSLGKLGAFGVQ